jgi:ribosomal-protein-alanine N-acetyltransferase
MTGPGSGPSILRVGAAHAEVLAAVQAACFTEAWSAPFITSILAHPGSGALLATDAAATPEAVGPEAVGPEAIGMALFRAVAGEAELLAIGVLPEARGRRVGRALLDTALADAVEGGARAMFLEVAVDNGPARALYRRAGFAPVGRRAGYYRGADGTPVDALVLRRSLRSRAGSAARPARAGDCFAGPKSTQ